MARSTHSAAPAPRADALATRARIVAAAEILFAERGIDAVSLVEIGKVAGQRNRSAVQYHFGDKRGVIEAILDKHTPGIEDLRHGLMDALEGEGDPDLRSLVQVLVRPVADKVHDPDGGLAFVRINSELIGHPGFPLLTLWEKRGNHAAERLQRLTARATTPLPAPAWRPRWLLVTGLLFHGLADWSRVGAQLGGPTRGARNSERTTWNRFVDELVEAIVAVLSAPPAKETP
jgi:AcrR family transcriptional regulator